MTLEEASTLDPDAMTGVVVWTPNPSPESARQAEFLPARPTTDRQEPDSTFGYESSRGRHSDDRPEPALSAAEPRGLAAAVFRLRGVRPRRRARHARALRTLPGDRGLVHALARRSADGVVLRLLLARVWGDAAAVDVRTRAVAEASASRGARALRPHVLHAFARRRGRLRGRRGRRRRGHGR